MFKQRLILKGKTSKIWEETEKEVYNPNDSPSLP